MTNGKFVVAEYGKRRELEATYFPPTIDRIKYESSINREEGDGSSDVKWYKPAVGKHFRGVIIKSMELKAEKRFQPAAEMRAEQTKTPVAACRNMKAGYNPGKTKDFFVKLKDKESYNRLEKIIRTHPYSEQREKCLERYISDELGL